MSYKEQLLDPKWQKKRLLILERDNWMCTDCFSKENTLHVHHLKYYEYLWDTPNEELKTLCDKCHSDFENKLKSIPFLIKNQCRLKINDPFVLQCVGDVFNKWENLHDLFYLLWENLDKQEIVYDSLVEIFRDENMIHNPIKLDV